jgi:cytochrome c-type biogenesis protein CcmH/NrfG
MTPEQIASHGAESVSDLRPDPVAAGWCVEYPDSLNGGRDLAETEVEPDAAQSARAGVFRVAGVLLLIVALVAYLVVPFNAFMRVQIREQAPTRARPIPVSPQHESVRLGV